MMFRGNSLHSAYQLQNQQRTVEKAWYKIRNKENKVTELTLKNTEGKVEGTHCLNTGKFFTLAEKSDQGQSSNNCKRQED